MSVIGNILWFIFAGFWQGVSWCLVGLVWCITIVGIPVGTQCFKMAGLAFFPFGKEVEYGGGAGVGHPQRAVVRVRRRVPGARGAAQRRAAVHHRHRHPLRPAMLQAGEACPAALRRRGEREVGKGRVCIRGSSNARVFRFVC